MTHSGRWARSEVKESIEDILDAAVAASPQIIVNTDGSTFVVSHEIGKRRPSGKAFLLRDRAEKDE